MAGLLITGASSLVVTGVGPVGSTAAAASTPTASYYIAMGASLVTGVGSTGGADYVNDIYSYAQQRIPDLQLVNQGCSGETTTTMINGGRCTGYTTGSQLGDAEASWNDIPARLRS
ncbi:MAG: hypothetical protein ACRDYE_02990 [Acidimicrobiales bacterium]